MGDEELGVRYWRLRKFDPEGKQCSWNQRNDPKTPATLLICSLFVRDDRRRAGALTGRGIEDLLAEADAERSDLDVLVGGNVLKRTLEAHLQRRREGDALAVALASHVGEFLGLAGIDRHVVSTGVFPDDHADVDFLLGSDEEAAALLNGVQGVGHAGAGLHGNEDAVVAGRDLALVLGVLLEDMGHDAVALGEVDEIGLKSDEPAGRHDRLDGDPLLAVVHVDDFGFASRKALEDVSEILGGDIDIDVLHRLEEGTVFAPLENDLGT